jgi:hypothetical protein
MKNEIPDKKIDDIYIFLTTAQFLLDFTEENFIDNRWAGGDLKNSLKTTMAKLQKVTSIPFIECSTKATPEMVEQHVTGSYLAEQGFRVALKFDRLSNEDKLKFQARYENLMKSFNLMVHG